MGPRRRRPHRPPARRLPALPFVLRKAPGDLTAAPPQGRTPVGLRTIKQGPLDRPAMWALPAGGFTSLWRGCPPGPARPRAPKRPATRLPTRPRRPLAIVLVRRAPVIVIP